MTDLEKLAVDICWAGFHTPPKGGKLKYWKRITPAARASYVESAKQFVWTAKKLGFHRVPVSSHTENTNERAQHRT